MIILQAFARLDYNSCDGGYIFTPNHTTTSIFADPPRPQKLAPLKIAIVRRQKSNPIKAMIDRKLASQVELFLLGKLFLNLCMLDLTNPCLIASLCNVSNYMRKQ